MSQLSLRRTLVSTAAAALVVGGSLGFVGAVAGADPNAGDVVTAAAVPAGSIELNNATATPADDCPDDGAAYWHFILASTGNGLDFTEIHLELAVAPPGPNDLVTFSGAQLVPNAGKANNVFVAVPAGHALDDIVIADHQSYAFYGGTGSVVNFTLSHTCEGVVPTTTSTSSSTTSSSTTSSSTTSSSTTSSSTTSSSTTSSSTTSTSTTSTSTTSTTSTTTSSSTTSAPTTTTAPPEVFGTVQTQPEAPAAVEAGGELPYTGSDVALMVVSGLCVLAGGAVLVAMARAGRRTTSGS